jgi:hypothetical protein
MKESHERPRTSVTEAFGHLRSEDDQKQINWNFQVGNSNPSIFNSRRSISRLSRILTLSLSLPWYCSVFRLLIIPSPLMWLIPVRDWPGPVCGDTNCTSQQLMMSQILLAGHLIGSGFTLYVKDSRWLLPISRHPGALTSCQRSLFAKRMVRVFLTVFPDFFPHSCGSKCSDAEYLVRHTFLPRFSTKLFKKQGKKKSHTLKFHGIATGVHDSILGHDLPGCTTFQSTAASGAHAQVLISGKTFLCVPSNSRKLCARRSPLHGWAGAI